MRNNSRISDTGAQNSSKHVSVPPSFNKLTRDGPYTGAWEDVPVEHAQFQLVLCLFQLPDHLVDKLKVALAVADEGIKHLRGA